jgi:hypothetical protein
VDVVGAELEGAAVGGGAAGGVEAGEAAVGGAEGSAVGAAEAGGSLGRHVYVRMRGIGAGGRRQPFLAPQQPNLATHLAGCAGQEASFATQGTAKTGGFAMRLCAYAKKETLSHTRRL